MKKYLLLFLLILSLNAATSTWKVRDSDGDTIFISSDGYIYHSGDTVFLDDILKATSTLKALFGTFTDSVYSALVEGDYGLFNDSSYALISKGGYVDFDSASIDNFIDDVAMDSTLTVNGGYIANVIAQAYKSEYNISSQLGSYVHGIKVEHTRTANIQPATGGWFGGQFVLNSGTTAWDDVNKASYAIQGVIKGDQWDGSVDVNAGRFELQSSGSVRDIVYILANSGTSVSSSMLYMPTHVSLPNMIQFNAQSNSTITNGIDFVSGAGSQFKYGIDFSGATIDTADIRLSSTGKIIGDIDLDGNLSLDTINSGTDAQITVTDDVILDSTLIVKIVPFAIPLESATNSYYSTCAVAAGGGTFHNNGYTQLYINQRNLDSIIIDSLRMNANFWGDSVALYMVYVHFYNISSDDTYSDTYIRTQNDSLYTTETTTYPDWQSKTFNEWNQNPAIIPPFISWSQSYYFHNRTSSSVTVRVYAFIAYGRAFYSQ